LRRPVTKFSAKDQVIRANWQATENNFGTESMIRVWRRYRYQITMELSYTLHASSRMQPVNFLNWAERWPTSIMQRAGDLGKVAQDR
jgi:hypothetical protein